MKKKTSKKKKVLDPNKQIDPIGLDNDLNEIKPKYKYNSNNEIIF